MSTPEREGPSTGSEESPDRAEADGSPTAPESAEQTLVEDPPSGMEKAEPSGEKAAAADEVDEDEETEVRDVSGGDSKSDASEDGDDTEVVQADGDGEASAGAADESDDDSDTVVQPRESETPDEGTDGIRVRYYGKTDVGLIREHNEDNFIVADIDAEKRGLPDGGVARLKLGARGAIFAVCDGMGGAAAGEVASQMAVDTIYEFFAHMDKAPRDRDHFARRLVTAIEEAGNRIFSAAKMDRTRRGMGTTATVAGLIDKVLFVGQVGDSRAYILRNGELGMITKDQSLVNQLIEAGQLTDEEAEAFEHSNIILQALGTTEDVTVDLTFLELRRGDRLMLCSDGLSGLVHQDMIRDVLAETEDLSECARKLVEMANAGGGHDNITVVCAEFTGDDLEPAKDSDRVVYQQYPLPLDDDPDRESLPPRDTSIKEGGRKPGADVKRHEDDTGPQTPAARGAEEDEAVKPFGWGLIAVVLLLAAVVAAVAVAMGGGGLEGEGEGGEGTAPDPSTIAAERLAAEGPEEEVPEDQRPVEVRIVTDVDGELFIDGQGYGPLHEGEDVYVELLPGPHRFEAISGGNVVTSAIITLRAGIPADVALTMPTGVTGDPEEGEGEGETPGEGEEGRGSDTTQGAAARGEERTGRAGTSPTEMRTTTTMRTETPAGTGTDTAMTTEMRTETPTGTGMDTETGSGTTGGGTTMRRGGETPRTGGTMTTTMTTAMETGDDVPDNPFEN